MRVVDIVASFAPQGGVGGAVFVDNSFYQAAGGKCAQETCVGCSQQRYATGQPGKIEARGSVDIVEGSCGYRACGVSIPGKFVLSGNPEHKTRGSPCPQILTPLAQ